MIIYPKVETEPPERHQPNLHHAEALVANALEGKICWLLITKLKFAQRKIQHITRYSYLGEEV